MLSFAGDEADKVTSNGVVSHGHIIGVFRRVLMHLRKFVGQSKG